MRTQAPFQPDDLRDLDALLHQAAAVIPMREIAEGDHDKDAIGMRHDVDNHLAPAVSMASWEAAPGYRSTYFILHTAPYWQDEFRLRLGLEQIAERGHEIGIHNNAVSASITTGRDPAEILCEAIDKLRRYGFDVAGTVAHGDRLCYDAAGKVRYVNDEMFADCPRPDLGAPDREVEGVQLGQSRLADFGLEYDANWLPRAAYLSDSGGRWSRPFDDVAAGFPFAGQLHMLVHPDWWADAFATVEAAA